MNALMSTLLGGLPAKGDKTSLAKNIDGDGAKELFQNALQFGAKQDQDTALKFPAGETGEKVAGPTKLNDILGRLSTGLEGVSAPEPLARITLSASPAATSDPDALAEDEGEAGSELSELPVAKPVQNANPGTDAAKALSVDQETPEDVTDEPVVTTAPFSSQTVNSAGTEPGRSETVGTAEKQSAIPAQSLKSETETARPATPATDRSVLMKAADANSQDQGSEMGRGGRRDEHAQNVFKTVSVTSSPQPIAGTSHAPSPIADQVTSALSGDKAFQAAASSAPREIFRANSSTPDILHTIKIQLRPAELGNVTAILKGSGDQLTVEIQVETEAARNKLSVDGDTIAKALRSLGYDIDRITIQQNANSHSATSQNYGSHGRENGFEQAASDGRSGSQNKGGSSNDPGGSGRGGASAQNQQNNAADTDSLYI
ncbi:flagellar hook-length control protein FliK [Nitratireductor basaltis]|uniref:Flagellar hook-length control protein n=1 Tax=Nitratireductor basaltis TaxID=472175 RepID=A0A084U893_9HYPH|nr:flagellar hook-length control protein FliK [Nitratireductor basaltis]KFB09179.1 Flagellar hook-length control protein precursor [Nitratireductor basaltis]